MMNPFVLGVIPARGGSKSVPRKNIRLLGHKPLIEYTLCAAKKCSLLSRYVVSTEDVEIAQIVKDLGVEVIERPKELARDDTPTLPVIQHAVRVIEEEISSNVDYIVILQATSPFRNSEDIRGAIKKLISTKADSVVSVCKLEKFHPWKIKRIVNARLIAYTEEEIEGTRRQDLPLAYIRNGGIYAVQRDIIMEKNSIFGTDCRPYIMPPERSVDINNEMDLIFAEALLQ
jgi:CMP-N-acetylneuraminic acid synthetase